jgi:hypothetical protein
MIIYVESNFVLEVASYNCRYAEKIGDGLNFIQNSITM